MENTPRRTCIWLNLPAETKIQEATDEIEKLGADINLTKAITLLSEAKELVSDYIDVKLK